MKKVVIFSTILCFIIHSSIAQNAYWETLNGPEGGYGDFFPTNSSTCYLYTDWPAYAFYRSEDYGAHWSKLPTTPINDHSTLRRLVIGQSGIFYVIIENYEDNDSVCDFYRSTDEGITWELIENPLNIAQVWETPTGALIGLKIGTGVYRSSDGGLNWQLAGTFTTASSPYVNVFFGDEGKILLANRERSLVYSTDDGQSWQMGGAWDFSPNSFLDFTSSGTLFRVDPDYLVYRSTDWGADWSLCDIQLTGHNSINPLPYYLAELPSGRLLLCSTLKMYFSEDNGEHWGTMNTSTEKASSFLINRTLPNGDLIGQNKGIFLRSSDQGVNWNFSSFGFHEDGVLQLAVPSDSLMLAVKESGLWKSTDNDQSWTRILPDTTSLYFSLNLVHPDRPLAVLNADSFAIVMDDQLWRTIDGGSHFQKVSTPDKLATDHLFALNGGILFASDSSGTLRSGDFGLSWQSVFPTQSVQRLEQLSDGSLIAIMVPLEEVYNSYALDTIHTLLFRSTDAGITWENVQIPGTSTKAQLADISYNAQGGLNISLEDTHEYRVAHSDDLGNSWSIRSLPRFSGIPLADNGLGHLFTVGYGNNDYGIFSTVDGGQSWFYLPPIHQLRVFIPEIQIASSGHLYVMAEKIYRSRQSTLYGGYVTGQVLRDADADCSTADADEPMEHWVVDISGSYDVITTTNSLGEYKVFVEPGTYDISTRVPQNLWWALCDTIQSVQVDSGQTFIQDFAAIPVSDCALIAVDISIPQLRRCMNNPVYVSYCNISPVDADTAWIDVELDPYLTIVSSTQPYVATGDNTYRFVQGAVPWGDCGDFRFDVYVNCDSTVLGQTHCITAHGFPDTLCTSVPNWSGATIRAQAYCENDTVRLELRNVSEIPSATLDYIIIEDDVVLLHQQKQYNANESIIVEYPANGRTWRIESEQEPGHPFSNMALAFLEGCGGYQSLGFINRFSVNDWNPSINQVCIENIGSFDPNDKQGFPTGYGDAHRIRPGQALEYMIRFQNTGTDTAFTVQIRDTLSPWLDPTTVRPGASSHAYTWNLSGAGTLTFRFDNIMLPDSNVNLAGSQGFVSFRIDQKPEVPLETQILNTAAIYFDFNEPVITNQTLHTVGVDYLTSVDEITSDLPTIVVQPNPAVQETTVHLPPGVERLRVFDVTGKMQRIFQTHSTQFRLERANLPSGIYLLQAEGKNGKVLGVGKVLWR